ncbi:unnamed protein product [Nippostrongylus brasiliensis]|uniref:Glutamate receptor n=1 Tax=Nippostrongylus brasiliensis TaxID=27835 RepID=A0A158R2E2_NIPBR|nr:unnamed protein product [Nippostrongylus brasiliensis]
MTVLLLRLLAAFSLSWAYKIAVPSDLAAMAALVWPRGFEWIEYRSRPVYRITPEFCRAIADGAVGAVLPLSGESNEAFTAAAIVESVARTAKIPAIRMDERQLKGPGHAISLMAPFEARARAVVAFIRNEGWKDVVLLYQTKRANPRFVAHVKLAGIQPLLTAAAEFGLCTTLSHFVMINWDTTLLKPSSVPAMDACNITTFSLFDRHTLPSKYRGITVMDALWKDSLSVLNSSLSIADGHPSCGTPWATGARITERMFNVNTSGITGRILVNSNGDRSNFTIHVYKTKGRKLQKYAEWASSTGVISTPNALVVNQSLRLNQRETLENKTLRVSVYLCAFVEMGRIQEAPFVMQRRNVAGDDPNDNETYEGYCIDLLKMVASMSKFNYTIHEVKDKAYGIREANGKWNGMVGELMEGEADLAVASLTITYSRSEVIDFTVPYMHLGISILFKKPAETETDWFVFLSPLSWEVWLCTFASYVVTSLTIWLLAKVSPFEKVVHDVDTGTWDSVSNQFSFRNACWFTVSSLMQQGSELSPRALSTRVATAVWWFFALILISSYTANLAAFLTTQRMVAPIENADDLSSQTKIKYGTLGRGSTMSFFNESKIDTYEKMWKLMSNNPSLFVSSSKEGIARVKSSEYAYLMESSMLEYAVERDCELMQIGGLLDQKGYGIGLPKGSPYREEISRSILRLQEKTVLTELKEKWWKDKSVVCPAVVKKGADDGGNIGGIFIILVIGLGVTIIQVCLELLTTPHVENGDDPPPRGIWYQLRHSLCLVRSSDHALKRTIDSLITYEQGHPTYEYRNRHTPVEEEKEGSVESDSSEEPPVTHHFVHFAESTETPKSPPE